MKVRPMNKSAWIFGICASTWGTLGLVGTASAGEFVTPRVQADQRDVPFCSSRIGCLLSGVALPDYGASVAVPMQTAEPAVDHRVPSAKPLRLAQTRKSKRMRQVTITADPNEAGRLKSLLAAMPRIADVKIVGPGAAPDSQTDFALKTTLDRSNGERRPLFGEQMQVLAGADIRSIKDLEGRVVSFGPDNSTSQAVARKAFEALHVPVNETPLDTSNALDGLSSGDIAAVVLLEPIGPTPKGQGLKILASKSSDPLSKLKAPKLHLVSWPEGAVLPQGGTVATVDAEQYPGLAKPAATLRAIGFDTVLAMNGKAAGNPANEAFLLAVDQHAALIPKRVQTFEKDPADDRKARRVASVENREKTIISP